MEKKFAVVHVGKCGGGTIKKVLNEISIDFEAFHMSKPAYSDNYKYLILTRDPVDRFISCWNWRYYLLSNKLRHAQEGSLDCMHMAFELKILEYYSTVDNFANALNDGDSHAEMCCFNILHVYKGFCWYLEELIPKLKPENINVIRTKFMSIDFEKLFKSKINIHNKGNYTKICPSITSESRMILKDFFSTEYRIIHALQEKVNASNYPVNILE